MYCIYCGTEIDDDSIFCHNCGAATGKVEEKEDEHKAEAAREETSDPIRESAEEISDPIRESVAELFEPAKPVKKKGYFGWKIFGFFLAPIALFIWLAWQSCDDDIKREQGEAIGIGLLAAAAMLVGTAIPLIPGIVLFFVLRKSHPEVAAAILVGTLVPILLGLVGTIVGILINIAQWIAVIGELVGSAGSLSLLPAIAII